ncbi:MAG: hypothetical protein LLG14_17545 [Nocardiaceae bacterium]|nr:hypothetical protein [Nocardiaceae bacterium]
MTDSSLASSPPGGPQVELRAAFKYGWTRFKDNAPRWVICTLWFDLSITQGLTRVTSWVESFVQVTFVWGPVSWIVVTQGAIHEVAGRTPTLGEFLGGAQLRARATAVLVWIIALLPVLIGAGIAGRLTEGGGIGLRILALVTILLTLFAEVILLFVTYYALTFALDQRQSPLEAVRSSVRLTRTNCAQLAPFALDSH